MAPTYHFLLIQILYMYNFINTVGILENINKILTFKEWEKNKYK